MLAQAHKQAITVVMTFCCMEAWNKHNPLTELYSVNVCSTVVAYFTTLFENGKQKIEMESGCLL